MTSVHALAGCIVLVVLAACSGGAGAAADGTWVGRLRTVAGRCPDQQDSDLSVSAGTIVFVPGDGVLSLYGKTDGTDPDVLHAQLLDTDINHHKLPMVFDGRLGGSQISGTYGTPTCRATITMHRPDRSLLRRIEGT